MPQSKKNVIGKDFIELYKNVQNASTAAPHPTALPCQIAHTVQSDVVILAKVGWLY